ncbi:phosphate butyryltransferase [Lachnospiraceae bacterium ZAX-1]
MVYHNFEELIEKVKGAPDRKRMAVAAAGDEHTLDAVIHARKEGIIEPVLVGDKAVIEEILAQMGETVPAGDIYDVADLPKACEKAVALVREGKADFLMKGKVDTGVILKAVVNKENGLGKGDVMSHFTMFDTPNYHKLLLPVDGGMVTYPTLEQKKAIIENTAGTLRDMGYECPKVGVLACVEKLNPKMPETVDANALQEMNRQGKITGCIIEGPISYDCAVDQGIAEVKGLNSKIAGDVDVLVAPNIHAGNIMGKMLACTCKARMAGFIVGAKCPIVLTSRGSSAEEKYLSIVISAAAAKESHADCIKRSVE